MRRHKLFPALILGLIITIGITIGFMMKESGNTSEPVQIHAVFDNSSDNRWVQFIAGMKQAADDQNMKLSVVPTGRIRDIVEEQTLIERAIAEGGGGVIVQLCSEENAAEVLENLGNKTNIELVDTGTSDYMSYVVGVVSPDHARIGKELAQEAVRFSEKPLSECSIAVMQESPGLSCMRQRLQGFTEELEKNGGKISWMLQETSDSESLKDMLQMQAAPDILVALDNSSLEAAGEYAATLDKEIVVVGTGTSTKAIYYLDSGVIKSLVVPEDYMMGYQSVTDLAEYIRRERFLPQIRTVQHRIVHQDTLFAEENQGILFPIQR